MRYLFVGAVRFSARCLEAVLEARVDLAAVLCPAASKFNSDFVDLAPIAGRAGVPTRRFTKIAEEAEFIKSVRPDVVLVLGLSQIIPPSILATPRVGCLGSHPSLLPQNRGRHPIIWTLANGLTEGGLSLFWLDEAVDSGDIWRQERFAIAESDDAGDVYARICEIGPRLLLEGLPELERHVAVRRPQDHSRANYLRKRCEADGAVDWRMGSTRIRDLVRALRPPYGGAHCLADGRQRKVWRATPAAIGADQRRFEPGRVLHGGAAPVIKTGDSAVQILESELGDDLQEGAYLA